MAEDNGKVRIHPTFNLNNPAHAETYEFLKKWNSPADAIAFLFQSYKNREELKSVLSGKNIVEIKENEAAPEEVAVKEVELDFGPDDGDDWW